MSPVSFGPGGFFYNRKEEMTEMRRKDREVTDKNEILSMLQRCRTVHIGIGSQPCPYVVPVSFGLEIRNGLPVLYFHSAKAGKKVELLGGSCEVSVTADTYFGVQKTGQGITTRYESVMGRGICETVMDPNEIIRGLRLITTHYGYPDYPLEECRGLSHVRLFRIRLEELTGKQNLPEADEGDRKRILLINDLPGYGKVALSAMIPVLSRMGFETFTLPTALVSNTFNYDDVTMLDTTDYMKKALDVWEKLGFSFPVICTGYIASARQTEIIRNYCIAQKDKGAVVIADPIMGDDGVLYHGQPEDIVDYMRTVCQCADLILPNMTEACLLADVPYAPSQKEETIREIVRRLHANGTGSIVITSANVEGQTCNIVSEGNDDIRKLPYTRIPVKAVGTGDIFTSLVTGYFLSSHRLAASVERAMRTVGELVFANRKNKDVLAGIPVEHFMDFFAR